jgi:hypothetical protein
MEIEGSSKRVDVYYGGAGFPFEDASFDSVVATPVLEHSFSPNFSSGNAPGGEGRRSLVVDGALHMGEHEIPYDFGRYSSFGLKALLERNGFEIQSWSGFASALALAQLASAFFARSLAWRLWLAYRQPPLSLALASRQPFRFDRAPVLRIRERGLS